MSFFKAIKRSLGFSGDDADEENGLYADTTDNDSADAPAETAKRRPEQTTTEAEAPTTVEFDPSVRESIFVKVVEVFNSALPDFLQRSVDPDAQRKLLVEALDSDTRAYVDSLLGAAEASCRRRWEERQAALTTELETARQKSAEIERKISETRQQQLSADRQKRALSDRVHDLEANLARLEAEREQFELENRSLVNRLKVAGVQTDDLEAQRNEIETLRARIAELEKNPAEAAAPELENLRAQVAEMTEGIAALKEQQRVADELLSDQRERTGAAEAALEETRAQLADTTARLDEANSQLEDERKQLAEATSELDGFKELSEKMEEIDRALSSREAKIKQQKKTIAARDAEVESLRQTIAENLRLQAEREKALQAETEALRAEIEQIKTQAKPYISPANESSVAAEEPPTEESAPIISESDLSDIEKTFESEEWFTKTPPAETPSMRPPEADADFGYHPPKRRNTQSNHPDQLSLF